MGKSFLAILSGYLLMALGIVLTTFLAVALFVPREMRSGTSVALPPSYFAAHFVLSFLCAVAGGWLAARMAPRSPIGHAAALAGVIVIFALGQLFGLGGTSESSEVTEPQWYMPAITVTGIVGALLGGLVRARQARRAAL